MNQVTINVVKGDDASLVFTIYDKGKNAIDLTGVTAVTFKASLSTDSDPAIDIDLTSGVAVTDAAAGEITVTLTDTLTTIDAGTYLFELQITDSGGNISTARDFNDVMGELCILEDLDT